MVERWKILIADDEPIIREGIRDAVQWEEIGLEVVAEAEDGEEALALALSHEVHIMLVDLNMPIMNGLTLIKNLKEQIPHCRIVIITGHDEFSYAQEAIQWGVDEYILKPVNAEQLSIVLAEIAKKLSRINQEKRHFSIASNQIIKNMTALRERFCLEWMAGELDRDEIFEQLEFLKLPLACPSMVGAVRWIEKIAGKPYASEKDRQLYLYAIENIIGELLEPWEHFVFRDQYGVIIVLLWEPAGNEALLSIKKEIQSYLKITVIQDFETVEEDWEGITRSYQLVKKRLYHSSQLSPMVRRGRQFIEDHYSKVELSLEDVSADLQVSSVYLSRKFKEELGTSFITLLTEIRMAKAIELLNTTSIPIHKIAELVGFDNQHYFSTSFKKAIGVPPKQYRQGTRA